MSSSTWAAGLFDIAPADRGRQLVAGYRSITLDEMLRRTDALGAFFEEQGWAPGRRLLIGSADDVELALGTLAALRWGHTAVVIHPGSHAIDVARIYDAAEADGAVFDREQITRWELASGPRKVVAMPAPPRGLFAARGAHRKGAAPVQRDDVAIVLPTSGTTGEVKLVPVTFRNLEAQVRIMIDALGVDEQTRILNLMPMSHVDGLVTGLLLALTSRTTSVRMPRITIQDLRSLFPTIYAEEVSHLLLVPSYLQIMLGKLEDLGEAFAAAERFRNVISTAAYLAEATWEEFERRSGTRIVNMYGLTETGNFVFNGPGDESHRIGALGKLVGVDHLVVDDAYQRVEDGVAGELLVAGDAIITGYWAVPPQGFVELEGRAWFGTGDLVVREADGFFRMVGRKKRIIITGGFNVHPEVIERQLTSVPGIAEAAVVDMPDAVWGERVVACVVTSDPGITRRAVYEALAGKLNNFQMPRELYLTDALPKGRSGKVPAAALRARVAELRAERSVARTGSIEARVFALAALAFRLPPERVTATLGSSAGDWDSIAHLDFVLSLEQAFSVGFDANQMMRIQTLADAIALVEELLDGAERVA